MIRGAIEIAKHNRVAGWIVSTASSLRGQTVLAFCGKACVGSGIVNVFRPDLLSVDLGDGHAGFDFPIVLALEQDPIAVVIRLEYCDAAIMQADCELVRRQFTTLVTRPQDILDGSFSRDRKSA